MTFSFLQFPLLVLFLFGGRFFSFPFYLLFLFYCHCGSGTLSTCQLGLEFGAFFRLIYYLQARCFNSVVNYDS